MIDPKLLRDNPEAIRASQRARGGDESLVDAALDADLWHRRALTAYEAARAEQKAAGK
ncbi:MAG: serine--tRNA ligase, partial [Micrococcales bacterium]|nr:serine--tRNA ligase [Micrococcales bacterium]